MSSFGLDPFTGQGGVGATGPEGATGPQGASIRIQGTVPTAAALPPQPQPDDTAYVTSDTGHLWVSDGLNWNDIGEFVGPSGPTGATGVAGPRGNIGLTGLTGATGPQGSTGPIGPTGSTGPAGLTGVTGPSGPQGNTGATGPIGAGLTGATGPSGPTGPQGPTGPFVLAPVGTILLNAGSSTAPTGWLNCDGSSLPVSSFTDLFAAIGYTFGGSGGNFNLPDTRQRTVRGAIVAGPFGLGNTGGQDSVILTAQNLPPHSHSLTNVAANDQNNDGIAGANKLSSIKSTVARTDSVVYDASGNPIASTPGGINITNQYIALRYIIKF